MKKKYVAVSFLIITQVIFAAQEFEGEVDSTRKEEMIGSILCNDFFKKEVDPMLPKSSTMYGILKKAKDRSNTCRKIVKELEERFQQKEYFHKESCVWQEIEWLYNQIKQINEIKKKLSLAQCSVHLSKLSEDQIRVDELKLQFFELKELIIKNI